MSNIKRKVEENKVGNFIWQKTNSCDCFKPGNIVPLCEYHADIYGQSKYVGESFVSKCDFCERDKHIMNYGRKPCHI